MRNEVLTHEPSVVSRYHSLNNEPRSQIQPFGSITLDSELKVHWRGEGVPIGALLVVMSQSQNKIITKRFSDDLHPAGKIVLIKAHRHRKCW